MKPKRNRTYREILYSIEQNLAVGQFLMDCRIEKGLSRDRLAHVMELSGSTIFAWEMGRVNWTDERISDFCHALDMAIPSKRVIGHYKERNTR